tara:strand:- start:73 stop:438 length:366 start_codon:yes stop_codon:yes gene_type:complete
MKVKNSKFKLKSSDWTIKVRTEGRRMKLYIKLNKEESTRWTEIKTSVMGADSVDDAHFAKILFFRGINAFMEDLKEAVEGMDEETREKLLAEHAAEQNEEVNVPIFEKESKSDANADKDND